MAGYTESAFGISTTGVFQTMYKENGDGMIAKYNPNGGLLWCTYFGAAGQDRFHAINLDLFGGLLVQGTTGSTTGLTTLGAHQQLYGGGEEDAMVVKW